MQDFTKEILGNLGSWVQPNAVYSAVFAKHHAFVSFSEMSGIENENVGAV